MPRPNQPRTVYTEENLARRIAHERAARGWTLENVAERMRDRGCPINNSAIYKIEKWDPPRRITVDELVAFASIFEMTVEDLLVPVELVSHKRFADLINEAETQIMLTMVVEEQRDAAMKALDTYADEHPEALAQFTDSRILGSYLEHLRSIAGLHGLGASRSQANVHLWEMRIDISRRIQAGEDAELDPDQVPDLPERNFAVELPMELLSARSVDDVVRLTEAWLHDLRGEEGGDVRG